MSDLNLVITVPQQYASEFFIKGLESVLDKCEVRMIGEEPKQETKKSMVAKKNYDASEHAIKRKMIKYRCDCGDINFKVVERGYDTFFYLPCKKCEALHWFDDTQLAKYEYECSCGEKGFFYTTADKDHSVKTERCRKCGNIINLEEEVDE